MLPSPAVSCAAPHSPTHPPTHVCARTHSLAAPYHTLRPRVADTKMDEPLGWTHVDLEARFDRVRCGETNVANMVGAG